MAYVLSLFLISSFVDVSGRLRLVFVAFLRYLHLLQLCSSSLHLLAPREVLQKHAFSDILKILQPKTENFQIKKMLIFFFFFFSAQNIDCGYSLEPPRRGGSNEYPQSKFLSRNKKK